MKLSNIKLAFLLPGLIFLAFQSISAQITAVKYQLKYNPGLDLFDCFLVIEAGSASTIVQRTQFNAQMTVVVPAGTRLHVEQNFWPRVQNQNYNSTHAINWNQVLLVKASAECPEHDYYTINPSLSPVSHYNNLAASDTLKLFSLAIDTLKGCASDIRLFENETDILSDHPCAGTIDLRNGFTMGGVAQLYTGNVIQSNENYAGDHETVCRSTSLLLEGNTLENATWRLLSGHLGDVTLDSLTPLQVEATFLQNSSGNYSFSFGNDQVSDFKCVTVNVPAAGPIGPVMMCQNSTANLFPTLGGMWSSSNISIATVSDSGLITAIAPGQTSVTYIENSSGCPSNPISVIVHEKPIVSLQGPDNICVGGSTMISPNAGGTWASNNPLVATVTNAGLITGINPGTATFSYTSTATGCVSFSPPISVNLPPNVFIAGVNEICIGNTTNIYPTSGGTWSSSNDAVATITNSGVVTGVAQGTATFTFTPSNWTCVSLPSPPITVLPPPTVQFVGPNTICVGDTSQVAPGMGGTWQSSNPGIATINNRGKIQGLTPGTAQLVFTETSTGCSSNPLTLTVRPSIFVSVSKDIVEINKSVTLSPNTGGNWYTSDTDIINIIGNTFAKGIGVGEATLYFQDSISGCTSKAIKLTVVEPFFTIVGYTFVDKNGNGLFDSQTDSPLPNCAIFIPELNTTFYTDKTGYYNIPVDKESYTAIFTVPYGEWVQNTIQKTIVVNNTIEYLFAGFQPTNQNSGGLVAINSSFLKCNSLVDLDVSVLNNTSQKQSGYLAITIDEKTFVAESTPFPTGSDGNTIFWEYLDLLPGHTFTPKVIIDVPMPEVENDSMFFHGFLLSQGNDTLTQFSYADVIECIIPSGSILSWPNRPGTDNKTFRDENLDYQIRFENTTNDNVNNAEVIVRLDPNIDISSILIKESSHPVKTYLQNDNLHFTFENIELSGKGLNNNKNGYLSFTCDFFKDVPDGTKIKNTAFIRLGNYPVMQTNESINTISSRVPCVSDEVRVSICPGESFTIAENVYYEPGSYFETIPGINGCDTLRNLILSFYPVSSDNILQEGNMLITNAVGNQYLWYDCISDELIATTEVPFLTPEINGSYYLKVIGEFCDVKTNCIDYIMSSLSDEWNNEVKIYPNPVFESIQILTEQNPEYIILRNLTGQVIYNQTGSSKTVDVSNLQSGLILIEIKTSKGIYRTKIVKQ
ncbi:MAG: Ig-like domain-containing protein [Saprospiraceae bacterium]|nr:Ig-like domain-containing protein [Saprospiraceae bacterium]